MSAPGGATSKTSQSIMLHGELQNVNPKLNLSTTIEISAPGGACSQINAEFFPHHLILSTYKCPRMANCCSSWEQATIPPFSRGSMAVKHSKSVCPSHKWTSTSHISPPHDLLSEDVRIQMGDSQDLLFLSALSLTFLSALSLLPFLQNSESLGEMQNHSERG